MLFISPHELQRGLITLCSVFPIGRRMSLIVVFLAPFSSIYLHLWFYVLLLYKIYWGLSWLICNSLLFCGTPDVFSTMERFPPKPCDHTESMVCYWCLRTFCGCIVNRKLEESSITGTQVPTKIEQKLQPFLNVPKKCFYLCVPVEDISLAFLVP